MRILFLTHSFNSLTQRLYVELTRLGHEVSIEFDINDRVAEEVVELFRPELIVAPFLKRAIPESIWRHHRCIIVHPGIVGDRGPSALDWAILRGESHWGVTCLEATAEMDAGDIWASVEFPMRDARKSSLYRNEVTEAALEGIRLTLERIESGTYRPVPLDYNDPKVRGRWNDAMTQADRAIDWQQDGTDTVIRKIHAADSTPGVRDSILEREVYLYGAHRETQLQGGPGAIIAQRDGAICRATRDGAVWITHLRLAQPQGDEPTFKLPAAQLLGDALKEVPEVPLGWERAESNTTWQEIRYHEANGVGYLAFEFYNGAMSTEQCRRLQAAYKAAKQRDTRVIVLQGGRDFWSNGIHLNTIEAADSAADESWANINAMDDLCEAIINTPDKFTVAAMNGNAGAGGVFMALAADTVWARSAIVLNPHYKSMGNLYGSEYWTYLLPKRVGQERAQVLTQNRLPIGAADAAEQKLVDACFADTPTQFEIEVAQRAEQLAAAPDLEDQLKAKQYQRTIDEAEKPLSDYRAEELERMKLNFYGFDPSYHVARYHFVEKLPKSRTPVYLARHRALGTGDVDKTKA